MNWFKRVEQDIAHIDARLKDLEAERQYLLKMRQACASMQAPAPKQGTIADEVTEVLKDSAKPLTVDDIYQRLKLNGREFKGSNPKLSIYVTLTRKPDLFTKLSKGWALANKTFHNTLDL